LGVQQPEFYEKELDEMEAPLVELINPFVVACSVLLSEGSIKEQGRSSDAALPITVTAGSALPSLTLTADCLLYSPLSYFHEKGRAIKDAETVYRIMQQ